MRVVAQCALLLPAWQSEDRAMPTGREKRGTPPCSPPLCPQLPALNLDADLRRPTRRYASRRTARATGPRGGQDGKGGRNRPRYDELGGRRDDGGGTGRGDPELRGLTDDAFGRPLHRGRRATCRPGRETTGDPQPRGDDLLGKAVHRPQV